MAGFVSPGSGIRIAAMIAFSAGALAAPLALAQQARKPVAPTPAAHAKPAITSHAPAKGKEIKDRPAPAKKAGPSWRPRHPVAGQARVPILEIEYPDKCPKLRPGPGEMVVCPRILVKGGCPPCWIERPKGPHRPGHGRPDGAEGRRARQEWEEAAESQDAGAVTVFSAEAEERKPEQSIDEATVDLDSISIQP